MVASKVSVKFSVPYFEAILGPSNVVINAEPVGGYVVKPVVSNVA